MATGPRPLSPRAPGGDRHCLGPHRCLGPRSGPVREAMTTARPVSRQWRPAPDRYRPEPPAATAIASDPTAASGLSARPGDGGRGSAADEGDAPVAVLELVGDVGEPLLAEHALERHGLERG